MSQKRTDQVAESIKHHLSEIIARELELPAGALVTIIKVDASKDLRYAKAWLTIAPEAEVGKVYGILRANVKELRQSLGEKLQLQFVPRLSFRLDRSAMAVEEVERLLEKIRNEK